MNWPSPGDIYYTAEGGERRIFYNVTGIPVVYVDGNKDNIMEYTQELFDNYNSIPSQIIIEASHTIINQTVDVNAGITAMTHFFDNNIFAFITIIENTTYNNIGNNGETEFRYVMKKMLPDAGGTQVGPLINNVEVNINESHTFAAGHTVEEFDDLSVVVFVQNITTGEVYQSAWSERLNKLNQTDNKCNIHIYPNPVEEILFISIFSGINNEITVEMINLMGETVFSNIYTDLNDVITVRTGQQQGGIYILKVNVGNETYISKIVIIKN